MWQDIAELIHELNSEFTAENLSRLLEEVGIIPDGMKGRRESFSKLIFLYCDKNEVYSRIEMEFIENVGDVILFPDFLKTVARGNMNCRYVGVDLSGFNDDLYNTVMFMKIVIKALSGFPIFVIKLSDGLHIGLRTFKKNEYKNCTMCETSRIEEVLEGFSWEDGDDFLDYYSALVYYVTPLDTSAKDYDKLGTSRRGVLYEYIDALSDIETVFGISTVAEVERYRAWFEESNEYTFKMQLDDYIEELRGICSTKVNTLEMLFEAEELEKLSAEIETKYEETKEPQPDTTAFNDNLIIEAGDNPEEMIRLLKLKHGLL